MDNLVSVIIPVYNRAHIVARTLQSVLEQSYRPLQLILVDNCSDDDSLRVLELFRDDHQAPDFQVEVLQEERHTAGAARNRGFSAATGSWLLFFDSDDVMQPQLVQQYMGIALDKDLSPDIVVTKASLVAPDGSSRVLPFHKGDELANHLLHGMLATQRYSVRREFFAATDGWNSDLPGWNDWEMGVRLLLANPKVAYLEPQQPLVNIYQTGTASITGTEFHTRQGQWERVIDLLDSEIDASSLSNKRRYHRLLDYRRIVLAAQYRREGHDELAQPLYREAYGRLKKSALLRISMPVLYKWLVAGRRGASSVARLLIR
ncbi:MAG: glycosyltransferase family 2 protein [Muribaculaceae bacterium]|nr:glycosyltransferase family 2 protein [Muribaculaceae bacterium]